MKKPHSMRLQIGSVSAEQKFGLFFLALIFLIFLNPSLYIKDYRATGDMSPTAMLESNYTVKYLSYDCKPLPDKTLYFRDLQKKQTFILTTDNAGEAKYPITGKTLTFIDTEFSGQTYRGHSKSYLPLLRHLGKHNFINKHNGYLEQQEIDNIKASNEPLILYPYEDFPSNAHRVYYSRQLESKIYDTGEFAIRYKNSRIATLNLSRKDGENRWLLRIVTPPNSGLITVNLDENDLQDEIPDEGYVSSFTSIIPQLEEYPKQHRLAFYLKYNERKEEINGRLSLSLTRVSGKYILRYFIDAAYSDEFSREKFQSPVVIPIERCGGAVDRNATGYYGLVSLNQDKTHSFKRRSGLYEEKYQRKQELKASMNTALITTTPLKWFADQPVEIQIAGLWPSETFEQRAKEFLDQELTLERPNGRLAATLLEDYRSNIYLLNKIYINEKKYRKRIDYRFFRLITQHPAISSEVADEIAQDMFSTYLAEHKGYQAFYQFLDTLFAPDSKISYELINKIISENPALFFHNFGWPKFVGDRISEKNSLYLLQQVLNHNELEQIHRLPVYVSNQAPAAFLLAYYNAAKETDKLSLGTKLFSHPNFPIEQVFDELEPSVVARAENHHPDVYWKLYERYNKDGLYQIRLLAKNESTPKELLRKIYKQLKPYNLLNAHSEADHRIYATYEHLSENPSTPKDIKRELASFLLEEILADPAMATDDLGFYFDDFRNTKKIAKAAESLVDKINLPPSVLSFLYRESHIDNRSLYRFVKNPAVPEDVLLEIFSSGNRGLRRALLSNPSLSQDDLLSILDKIRSQSELKALLENPSCSEVVIKQLIEVDLVLLDKSNFSIMCSSMKMSDLTEETRIALSKRRWLRDLYRGFARGGL